MEEEVQYCSMEEEVEYHSGKCLMSTYPSLQQRGHVAGTYRPVHSRALEPLKQAVTSTVVICTDGMIFLPFVLNRVESRKMVD